MRDLLNLVQESTVKWNGKNVVAQVGEYRIAVDDPADARYVSVWDENGKNVGVLSTRTTPDNVGRDYLSISRVELSPKHRGNGLGLAMYRALLGHLGGKWKGIGSYLPDQANKRQVPAIWRRLGGRVVDDHMVVDRKVNITEGAEQMLNLEAATVNRRATSIGERYTFDIPTMTGFGSMTVRAFMEFESDYTTAHNLNIYDISLDDIEDHPRAFDTGNTDYSGTYSKGLRVGPTEVRRVLKFVMDRVRQDGHKITNLTGDRVTGARSGKEKDKRLATHSLSEGFEWKKSAAGSRDVVVMIDVAKVDASAAKDKNFYVGPTGENGIKGRYERFNNWMAGGDVIEMPEVCLTDEGRISFINGRHRFAWMRDHGVETMPVSVPAGDAEMVKAAYGVENLNESATVFPSDLIQSTKHIHHTPEDFSDGDLGERIWKFTTYVLRDLPISQLDLDEWDVDHERAQEYAAMSGEAPPIIYDADEKSIIDGTHRANAAALRGDRTIKAWVGLPENIDPDHEIDESVERIDELSLPPSRDEADQVLLRAGYTRLGSGKFANVYQKPGTPYVLKVFDAKDQAFKAFITLTQTFNSPHFPKFIGKPLAVTPAYMAIRSEVLTPVEDHAEEAEMIHSYIVAVRDYGYARDDHREYMLANPSLKEACDILAKFLKVHDGKFHSDIWSQNLMMRGSTLVLNDPVAVYDHIL